MDRIRVRRNRGSGRWQVFRGRRVVKTGLEYAAALDVAVRLADADRVAARRALLAELNAERFNLTEES